MATSAFIFSPQTVLAEIYQYSLKWWIYNWNIKHTEKFWHCCACRLGNVCQFIAEMAEGGHQRVWSRCPLSLHATLLKREKIVIQVLPSTITMDLIHFAHAICIYWQYNCIGKMQLYCTGNSTWILAISSYELGSIKAWK